MASTSAGPWSVKGVDPKAREIAKDMARRSGMTLGEWLNRFIADSGEAEGPVAALAHNLEATGGGASRQTERAELRKLVEALQALSTRLDRSEADSGAALRSLRESYGELEARLSAAETRVSDTDAGAVERRFEALAAELHDKVEAGRAEIAERLREAAAGQFEKVEEALRDLSGHVEQTERRSHRAIERLGEEMMRVATLLNSRVASAESRSAQAVEIASGEIAKVATTVEGRMGQAEQVQAAALERLGSEISRIAERLADRIAGSERRSAAAIDDIGLQVNQAADRIDQRYDRANTEAAERLRETEERTARLLAEARDRLVPATTEQAPPTPARSSIEPERAGSTLEAKPEPQPAAPEPRVVAAAATAPPSVFADLFAPSEPDGKTATEFEPIHDFGASADPFGPLPPLEPMTGFGDAPLYEPADAEPAPAALPVEPQAEALAHPEPTLEAPQAADGFGFAAEALVPAEAEPPAPAEPERPKTTRELLESARAAARLAAAGPVKPEGSAAKRFNLSNLSLPSLPSIPALPKLKRKDAGLTLRTAVVASGTAAAICVTAVGAFKVYGEDGTKPAYALRGRPTDMAALAPSAAGRHAYPPELAGAPTAAPARTSPALATVALAAPAPRPASAEKRLSPEALYANAAHRIESGDPGGLSDLFKAAGRGVPAAQLYLAKLYEQGTGGIGKDMVQARRWTARAAQAGDVKAMHNLGLYYFEGDGGEKNTAAAADWFKRAAELGLQDSQYNLARLYQQGVGVGQNSAEAYKWYLVAAANGDAGARNDALAVRKSLGTDEAAAAERSAAAIQQQARATTTGTPAQE